MQRCRSLSSRQIERRLTRNESRQRVQESSNRVDSECCTGRWRGCFDLLLRLADRSGYAKPGSAFFRVDRARKEAVRPILHGLSWRRRSWGRSRCGFSSQAPKGLDENRATPLFPGWGGGISYWKWSRNNAGMERRASYRGYLGFDQLHPIAPPREVTAARRASDVEAAVPHFLPGGW